MRRSGKCLYLVRGLGERKAVGARPLAEYFAVGLLLLNPCNAIGTIQGLIDVAPNVRDLNQ